MGYESNKLAREKARRGWWVKPLLFFGLMAWVVSQGYLDREHMARYRQYADDLASLVRSQAPPATKKDTGGNRALSLDFVVSDDLIEPAFKVTDAPKGKPVAVYYPGANKIVELREEK